MCGWHALTFCVKTLHVYPPTLRAHILSNNLSEIF